MRILYWTPLFWPNIGGIETLSINALPALQRRNYEFVVVASHNELNLPDEMNYNGIPIYRFQFWKALTKRDLTEVVRLQKRVAYLKRTFKPDLVHLHFPGHLAYFHVSTLNAHPAPTLLTVHTDFYGTRGDQNTMFGKVLRSSAWTTAVSESTLSDISQIVPEILNRSSVIYNGLEAPKILPEPIPFDPPRILCIGRLVHDKGFDLVITVFAPLIHSFPQARLIIAGDGPAREDLERQAAALGLKDAVEFTGWISPNKVPELINKATVVVIPSRYREPFAIVAVEAAQMARPVIATRIGGLTESVIHKQTGLLFEMENVQGLFEAISFILDHPDTAMRMGHNGRARALDIFGLEKYVDAYDRLYLRLINEAENAHSA
ncbi:MAG TPA: glycosyltransferase family 4 protein [Thermodesulfobacteriota bacterium]|nr:glycosyltransferase family 4 protein [Thermodesulfobacteriota bacterium]